MYTAISKIQLKYLTSLCLKKYRDQEKKFIVEGQRICEEALNSNYIIESLFLSQNQLESEAGQRLLDKAQQNNITIFRVTEHQIKQFTSTVHCQGIAALVQVPAAFEDSSYWLNTDKLLALDQISDPGNLGTIIRTADWFGIDRIILSTGCVELFNPKVLRATAGSVFHLSVKQQVNLAVELALLKEMGFHIIAGDPHKGRDVNKYPMISKTILLMGNEASGIDTGLMRLIDAYIRIPGTGKAESLNVATATAILLYLLSMGIKRESKK